MSKHTPGPWFTFESFYQQPNRMVVYADKEAANLIADCALVENDEQEANARLIAAAPELLAACRAIVRTGTWTGPVPDGFNDAWESAMSAIAKATGI